MSLAVRRLAVVVLLLVFTGLARGADVPYPSGRIVDDAELLSPETFDRVGALLCDHESRTGNQIAALTTPGMGWFLYFFLIPFWAMFPIIVVGTDGALKLLVTYLVGFPMAKVLIARRPWYKAAEHDLKTKGKARIGGFTLGGSSGSSGSSWSSSSGGFSGGGGSSSDGGASGSW